MAGTKHPAVGGTGGINDQPPLTMVLHSSFTKACNKIRLCLSLAKGTNWLPRNNKIMLCLSLAKGTNWLPRNNKIMLTKETNWLPRNKKTPVLEALDL